MLEAFFGILTSGKNILRSKSVLAMICPSAEGLEPPNAFQAEYEGSTPFTRSFFFDDLACERSLLPTNRAEAFRQGFPRLFAMLRAAEAALNPASV